MDALTITVSCVSLLSAITALSKELTNFVVRAREARNDIDGFCRELTSLSLCVATLQDENYPFPTRLRGQLIAVLNNCDTVTKQMMAIIQKHKSGTFGRRVKWSAVDGEEVMKLRDRLEAHKSALQITLDLAQLTVVNSIKDDTTDLKQELQSLKMQITLLSSARAKENPMLQRFLDDSLSYAESTIDPFETASDQLDHLPEDSQDADSVLPQELHKNAQGNTRSSEVRGSLEQKSTSPEAMSTRDGSTAFLEFVGHDTKSLATQPREQMPTIRSTVTYQPSRYSFMCEQRIVWLSDDPIYLSPTGWLTTEPTSTSWPPQRTRYIAGEVAWALETGKGVLFFRHEANPNKHSVDGLFLLRDSLIDWSGPESDTFRVHYQNRFHYFTTTTTSTRMRWVKLLKTARKEGKKISDEIASRETYKKNISRVHHGQTRDWK